MIKIEHELNMKSEKPPIPRLQEVRFENERLTALGIEPMTLAELRGKVSSTLMRLPQRIDFFMLMLVTAGQGRHVVDFVEWPLAAGSLVFVRPGQVQQWHMDNDIDAQLVLIAPSTLPHRSGLVLARELEHLALDEWLTCTALDPVCAGKINAGLLRLRQDFDQFDGSDLDVSLIRHELMTLLLRLARQRRELAVDSAQERVSRRIYRLFLQALDTDFQQQHSLQHYARRLGYSESTLSRACVAAEGRSAKQVIDRRIALEAQRLLVHSTASVAEIAHQLGFSETTNFVKFFRRLIGDTPSAFRRTALPGA